MGALLYAESQGPAAAAKHYRQSKQIVDGADRNIGLAKLVALPSGSGVFVIQAKQGNAVLLQGPATANGRCIGR